MLVRGGCVCVFVPVSPAVYSVTLIAGGRCQNVCFCTYPPGMHALWHTELCPVMT